MSKDTIYVYVDGSNLEESEEVLTAAFAKWAAQWSSPSLVLINDRASCNDTGHSEDYPEWTLGLNVAADALAVDEIASLLRFTRDLAARTGHDFVFGLADQERHVSEDICFIDADAGDKEQLMMLTAIAKN